MSSHVFEKSGLHVEVELEDVMQDGSLLLPAIRDRLTPGFAGLLSETEPDEMGVRIYLPVRRDHAGAAGHEIAAALQSVTNQYVVKALTQSLEYPRPDSFTVYVGRNDHDAVLNAVDTPRIRGLLERPNRASLFAKAMESGVAWMEGLASRSAGEMRSLCVARAFNRHHKSCDTALRKAIEAELENSGIDPVKPYLTTGEPFHGD